MPDDANSVFVGSYPDVIFLVDIYIFNIIGGDRQRLRIFAVRTDHPVLPWIVYHQSAHTRSDIEKVVFLDDSTYGVVRQFFQRDLLQDVLLCIKKYKPEMVPTHNVPSLSVKRDMILLLAALASGSK